jgi:hypothetical protein
MLLAKVKVALGTLFVFLVFAAAGVAYQAGSGPATGKDKGKPLSEVEALRRENELLRLNLQVVLEKVQAQEAELRALRGQKGRDKLTLDSLERTRLGERVTEKKAVDPSAAHTAEGISKLAEALLERNREAAEAQRRLAEEQALKQAQAEADLASARAAAELAAQERARLEEEGRKEAKQAEDAASLTKEFEKALKVLQEAKSKDEKERAIDALVKLLRKFEEREAGPPRIISPRLSPGQNTEKKR